MTIRLLLLQNHNLNNTALKIYNYIKLFILNQNYILTNNTMAIKLILYVASEINYHWRESIYQMLDHQL